MQKQGWSDGSHEKSLEVSGIPVEIKPFENGKDILIEGTSKLSMPYWLSAGTALGLYRDKDFIQGDTDIDVAMVGYDGIEQDLMRDLGEYLMFRRVALGDKLMQLAFKAKGVIFDVYIHWEDEDNYVNIAGSGKTIMPKRIYDTVKVETKYGTFPFPNPPEEYFEIRYGKDWRTPQDKKPTFF